MMTLMLSVFLTAATGERVCLPSPCPVMTYVTEVVVEKVHPSKILVALAK